MKKISLVSSCYNEEGNIETLWKRVKTQLDKFSDRYEFEYVLLDNCSTDRTAEKLRELASQDNRVKVILNARNFGHIRSPYWGILQASGEAVIYLASDLQDPPELISDFIEKWEQGYKIVLGVKKQTEETFTLSTVRKTYYWLLNKVCDDGTNLVKNATGFGLFDKCVVDIIREIDDPYPYLRGLVCEIGYEKALVEFNQPTRKAGFTKNNFYTLYDNAMIGFVKHSKMPLRLMAFGGFIMSLLTFMLGFIYLVLKLFFWNAFSIGIAPIIISILFLGSIQLFCLGVLGEYVGAIYTRIDKKPVVVEKERINF
ncbi:glycosyltransferase family 2 protein [bacterium]|nr:glycosyltransferase family 2 protein [bacterium]